MARRALGHCANAELNYWNFATQAEAHLMLDDIATAEKLYLNAIGAANSPRAQQSTYSQALLVALRVAGAAGGRLIEQIFCVARIDK
jgi:hypothetical protein